MKIQVIGKSGPKISKYIYGHFAEHLGRCIYDGIYVGEDSSVANVKGYRLDVIEALKAIQMPVLRWPGGCFADDYHWKDGVGPKENRKRMVNNHWGGGVESNHFGTHEFLEFCQLVGCEAYISGNVGSGTVQEMQEWIEYITMPGESPMANWRRENGQEHPWKLAFLGVGNENWGCGGNMRPEYYADLYRRYQTYVRQYGDNKIYKIACGPGEADYEWTETLLRLAAPYMDGLSLHHYCFTNGWNDKGQATEFSVEDWWSIMEQAKFMDELITKNITLLDKYDPEKRIGLVIDEWGNWFNVEPGTNPAFLYQQNTIRDAMVAAISLGIFNKHAERVEMANLAQMVNVLQSILLTEGDQLVKTPTYHVFDLYQSHQDAELMQTYDDGLGNISYTLSHKEDYVTVSLANYSLTEEEAISIKGMPVKSIRSCRGMIADHMTAYNDFDQPDNLSIVPVEGWVLKEGCLEGVLPPMAILTIQLEKC